MNFARNSKSVLLQSCGGAALALGVMALPTAANAQAFQATPNVVQGSVTIDRAVPNVDTITVDGLDAVIDWTPDDINGTALTFLPAGNTAVFQSLPGATDFAIINRVLPSLNGDVTVMNGAVISQLQQLAGPPVPGGNVMFYSSTGLIIGSTATFDVGGLVLTSLAPDISAFGDLVDGVGPMSFTGVANDSSFVQIDPGATITGSQEGSGMAILAPQILMGGTVDMNGSVAYIGAQEATIAVADGLFDIIITTGSNVATPIVHDGTTTGPASTGGTDNHVIYGVTAAQANPVATLFQGNLGYQPAVSATIDNGEIVLTANYNVSGRDVGFNTFGDTTFEGVGALSSIDASIAIVDANFSSNSLVISSGTANVSAQAGNSTIDGNITVYSQNSTDVSAFNGNTLTITGDLVAAGYKRGELAATSAIPGQIDGIGNFAGVFADTGSTVNILGNARIDASGLGGFATSENLSGNAFGGVASLATDGGTVNIAGDVRVDAIGSAFNLPSASSGGETGGGFVQVLADNGGLMNIDGTLIASASAFSPNLPDQTVTTPIVGNAFAGQVFVQTFNGSTTTIDGSIQLSSTAGGASTANTSATGGSATGNFAAIVVNTGGDFTASSDVLISVGATAGDGHNGGDALAGSGGINVEDFGTATVLGTFTVQGTANGGDATAGFGGVGGDARGRLVFVASSGSDTQVSTVNLADVVLESGATGGVGGAADGSTIAAGAGGTGMAGTFDTGSLVGGAYVQAGRNNAVLNVGNIQLSANGAGGMGGAGSATQVGGDGGDGLGGTVFIGVNDLIGSTLTTNPSTVTFGDANATADGFGWDGGTGAAGQGAGGDGLGGDARLVAFLGDVTGGSVAMTARGFGGNGSTGGLGGPFAGLVDGGFDGGVSIEVYNSSSLTVQDFGGFARGFGGDGTIAGGDGVGGYVSAFVDGTLTVNDFLTLDSLTFGGDGQVGGDAFGGIAELIGNSGTVNVTNGVNVFADALAGNASVGFGGDGGFAQGGNAIVLAAGTLTADATVNIGGNVNIRSTASGGDGGAGDGDTIAPGAGGDAAGGDTATSVFGFPGFNSGAFAFAFGDRGTLDISGSLSLNASAAAGNGGMAGAGQLGGAGGNADSGDAFASVIPGSGDGSVALGSVSAGATTINSNAFAGNGGLDDTGTVITGLGGNATAGRSLVQAQFGTVTLGVTTLSTNAFGGTGSTGGTAIGGFRSGVSILNSDSGTIVLDSLFSSADGIGGAGTNGNGGDGTGGAAFVGFQGGAITILGTTSVIANGTGGSATNGDGGTGTGGLSDLADFTGTPGSGDFQGTAQVTASGIGGDALSAGFDGGAGIGGTAFIESQPGSILNAADVNITAFGRGGNAIDGIGGLGQGGSTTAEATGVGAQIFAGSIQMNGGSIGGNSTSGTGGDAEGGFATAIASESGALTVDTQFVVNTVATAGNGATGGNSSGGSSMAVVEDATLSTNLLDVNSNANTSASSGGAVLGGIADVIVIGTGSLAANNIVQSAEAFGAAGGSAIAGTLLMAIDPGTTSGTGSIDTGGIFLDANASGSTDNVAGGIAVEANNGTISAQSLNASALGATPSDPISLVADSGPFNISITSSAIVQAIGDINVITGNGGLIVGGINADNLSATFDFGTTGLLTIIGDNDNLISFGALNMTLESSDIDVQQGARFGAVDLSLVSNNTDHTAVVGGTTDGLGYTLTQEEASRIEGDSVSFFGPITEDPIAIEVRDLTIFGTQDEGVSSVTVETPGTLSIVGQIEYIAAAASDQLVIQADQTLQIIIPGGGISMTDTNDELSGQLSLQAQTIVAAVSDIVDQVSDDPQFAGLADLLATNDGSLAPEGYVRANAIALVAGENLYIQNTGTADVQGGVLVGDGSLIIGSFSQTTGSTGSGGFTFSGVLMDPNDVLFFDFTVSAASDITLRTYSYAGGTSSTGDVVAAGGFDPILALFDSNGDLIDQNDDGGIGVPADPVTGSRYDTLLETNVPAGDYTVSVSVFPNFAGDNINDPFQGATSFNNRTPNYYFEITGVDSASGGVVGGSSGPLNVFAYGARQGEGGLVTGIDFYNELDFGDPETVSDRFTELSTFNDCLIVGGNCGQAISSPLPTDDPEIIQVVETVTTASIAEPPPEVVAQAAEVVEQSDADTEFGVDFPGLFNPPTVQDQSVVREPVTSGGDAANYAENDSESDEEEQDDT